jgi:STE24 endopeptidase
MWLTLAALTVLLLAVMAVATPWSPWPGWVALPPDATRDFTPAQIAAADRLHDELRLPTYLGLAGGVLIALALGLTSAGARLVRSCGRLRGRMSLQVAAGTALISLVVSLVALPFAGWRHEVLVRYGLSTQPTGDWLLDVAKSWGVTTSLSVLALVVLTGLARRLPRWWFAPTAGAAAACVVAASFLYPVLVEPLFNSFQSMRAEPLRTSLLDLARRDGVGVNDVLVADASRRTTTLNAYVSGFAGTRRIVVYDTLLASAPPAEVRLVVAHELGHAEANDVAVKTAVGALGAGLGTVALALALRSPRLLRRSGARSAGDPAVVALVLALYLLASLLSLPVQNLVSRQLEARADVHALDLTNDPATFIRVQRRLAITNRTDLTRPVPSYVWFATHPSPSQRIAIARRWAHDHDRPAPAPHTP